MILAGVAGVILALELAISSTDLFLWSMEKSNPPPLPLLIPLPTPNNLPPPHLLLPLLIPLPPPPPRQPDCTIFANGKQVSVNASSTNIKSIRESLQALLTCDLDLDKEYFRISTKLSEYSDYYFTRDYNGLMLAVHYDLADIAETLLTDGADVHIKTYGYYNEKINILTLAASLGHKEVIAVLVDNGADITEAFHAAVLASHADIAADLLDKGANIDNQGKGMGNWTALMEATYFGHDEVFNLLIGKGANVNLEAKGQTALAYSWEKVKEGIPHRHFMTLLERGADVNVKYGGKTILMLVSESCTYMYVQNCDGLIQALVDHGANINDKDNRGRTALMLATQEGRPPFQGVAKLINLGADTNLQDSDGNTALMLAIQTRAHDWAYSGSNEFGSLISLLMDAGSDPNIRNKYSKTALIFAAASGLEETVVTLLDHGADINAQSYSGMTSLHSTLRDRHQEVAIILLNRGADRCIRNNKQQTAAQLAVKEGLPELARTIGYC